MRNTFFPTNPDQDALIQSHVADIDVRQAFIGKIELTAAQAHAKTAGAVHAAVVDTGAVQIITTGFTAPPYPSNISVTYGGTAADIKGGHQVTITGTDMEDQPITEVLPAATANTAETLYGEKIFKTVDSENIPVHDGVLASTALGYGDKKGIPFRLHGNTVLSAFIGNPATGTTKEGTAPTVTTSPLVLSSNGFTLNTALSGVPVAVYLLLP